MKIGIHIFPNDQPVDATGVARRAEELGFDSLWVPEHPAVPVTSAAPFPGTTDAPIPRVVSRMVDPFVALARASAVTRRIRLGTGVCLPPERNPLLLAKEVATLDHLSGGRLLLGIGAGWLKEEIEIMGGNFPHRWTQTYEAIQAMKELWTKDEAEYHGTYYEFPPVRSFPKPFQKPNPPILLGGSARNVFKRIVAWGDGWMPTRAKPEEIRRARQVIDGLAIEAGRDPRSIQILAYDAAADRGTLRAFEEAGADAAVLRLASPTEEEALADLERMARDVLS